MIRKMKKSDFEAVNKIFVQVHDIHADNRPDIFVHKDPAISLETFLERLHDRTMIKLVSINDKKRITGFTFADIKVKKGLLSKKRKIMAIHEIGVDSSNRSTGFGTELILELKRIAKEKKCDEVLLSVFSFNERAIAFYKKNGFEVQSLKMELK